MKRLLKRWGIYEDVRKKVAQQAVLAEKAFDRHSRMGCKKKEFALSVIMTFIASKLDLNPFVTALVRFTVSLLINKFVRGLNKRYGHNWLQFVDEIETNEQIVCI